MAEINFVGMSQEELIACIKTLQNKIEKQEVIIKNMNKMLTKNRKAIS